MSLELKRGLVRVLTNYTRLLTTLALGIAVVPLTIAWLGDEAFGLISLLGANIGLGATIRKIIQQSLVRELGAIYHAGDEKFAKGYTAICAIAAICAFLTLLSFAAMYFLIPVFNIPPQFTVAAGWFIIGQGAKNTTMVILAPILNMYLVTERFIGYNIWTVADRTANILSVLILGYLLAVESPATGLTAHGMLWGFISIIVMTTAAAYIMTKIPGLMLRFRGADKETKSEILATFSWNTGVQVAMNLHEQIPPILMNLFIGPLANAAWGVGFRLVSYIRMATTGVQFGSDAVSARLASHESSSESRKQLQGLINIQTRLTAMIAMPAAVLVFFYARPIFELWIGRQINAYDQVMPTAVIIARILSFAILARSVSDSWLIVLYGAGFVKRYAPLVIIGGFIAPVGAVTLMLLGPDSMTPYAPAVMFTVAFSTFHLIGIPIITGRCLHISGIRLLLGLWRPILAAALSIIPALAFLRFNNQLDALGYTQPITRQTASLIDPATITFSIIIFGLIYALLSFCLILRKEDRTKIWKITHSIKSRIT